MYTFTSSFKSVCKFLLKCKCINDYISYVRIKNYLELTRSGWHELAEVLRELQDDLSASQIYRFNRDVEDAVSHIQEKYSLLPEDLGTFDDEMIALETEVSPVMLLVNIQYER